MIAVVAPSSPYSRDELWRGLAWLHTRYRIRMSRAVLAREGYLAGDDALRTRDFAEAMLDEEVKAIVAARGGYGAMRIVEHLPWTRFASRPKWIIGFSDITAIHAAAWRVGVSTIHGPHVTSLARSGSPRVRAAWLRAVERPGARHRWRPSRVLHAGRAAGPVVGGNLTVIHALAAARQLEVPRGSVLALEDVAESPYRIDRMLTSLLLGGYLANLAAVVFGGFDHCRTGPDGRSVEDVLEERTRSLRVPVVAGAPFGHGDPNEAFVLGVRVSVGEGDVIFEADRVP
jgi:muramoyltetrapeptide carboxypeptidase